MLILLSRGDEKGRKEAWAVFCFHKHTDQEVERKNHLKTNHPFKNELFLQALSAISKHLPRLQRGHEQNQPQVILLCKQF